MSTGWNFYAPFLNCGSIINLLGNEYWLELLIDLLICPTYYKPTGK